MEYALLLIPTQTTHNPSKGSRPRTEKSFTNWLSITASNLWSNVFGNQLTTVRMCSRQLHCVRVYAISVSSKVDRIGGRQWQQTRSLVGKVLHSHHFAWACLPSPRQPLTLSPAGELVNKHSSAASTFGSQKQPDLTRYCLLTVYTSMNFRSAWPPSRKLNWKTWR